MSRTNPLPVNINTILALLTIVGMIATGFWFIAPLKTLPEDMKSLKGDMGEVQKVQAVQASTMSTLADVVKDTRDLRRDQDKSEAERKAIDQRQDVELEGVRRRLEKVEKPR